MTSQVPSKMKGCDNVLPRVGYGALLDDDWEEETEERGRKT